MKEIAKKKPPKDAREKEVLLGLIELYLQTGKPIGSNTLRENGFEHISSATIRNYFAKLEEEGFLRQQHSSGGRIPTHLAYKLYAQTYLHAAETDFKEKETLNKLLVRETREIAGYLQHAAEKISELTGCALFLSAPRFDQDFVLDIRLMGIDNTRCLCILITDFGLIHTELLHTDKKLSSFTLKRIEAFMRAKITAQEAPSLSEDEAFIASHFYSEVMLRHIVGYANFSSEDIYKTGFSRLLRFPDFNDACALANGLALFENPGALRGLLKECVSMNHLSCWVGDEMLAASCSIIAAPYHINQIPVGAIAILGPHRIEYKKLFRILHAAAECISETLTKSIYKFKITYRQPSNAQASDVLHKTPYFLLEDKSRS